MFKLTPLIAIVGRPNVGKSTLFNSLTGSRSALVADVAGVTRDRHYGIAKWNRPLRKLAFKEQDLGTSETENLSISRLYDELAIIFVIDFLSSLKNARNSQLILFKFRLFFFSLRLTTDLITFNNGVTTQLHSEVGLNESRSIEESFIVIDTGGIAEEADGLSVASMQQTYQAIAESDFVFFVVDGRNGFQVEDASIAQQIRSYNKKVFLLINKTEGLSEERIDSDFYSLGFAQIFYISATHRKGIDALFQAVFNSAIDNLDQVYNSSVSSLLEDENRIRLAIIGRPNVGKSTFVNYCLGEDRMLVSSQAGTTRDSIAVPLDYAQNKYTLIDTAGVRRQSRIDNIVERFSVSKSLQSIYMSQVVILVIDGTEGVTDQDLRLLNFVVEAGKAIVIAVNKSDLLSKEQKKYLRSDLQKRLIFASYIDHCEISALLRRGLPSVFKAITLAYGSSHREHTTSELTDILQAAVAKLPPPLVNGKTVKLLYAHPGGYAPPVVILHGRNATEIPVNYQRYLKHFFYKALRLHGTPLVLEFRRR